MDDLTGTFHLDLTLRSSGAAFGNDGEVGSKEVARILRDLAERIERRGITNALPHKLADINGNSVGAATGGFFTN